MTPLEWLLFWLAVAMAGDLAAIAGLYWLAHSQAQRAYRSGWVDGTMGREYGESYPGKLAYPARHNGQPVAAPEEEWLPPTPPGWDEDVWGPPAPEPPTLEGTIILARDDLAATAWHGETDTAWTKRMGVEVRERLAKALDGGAPAIESGVGDVHARGTVSAG
jgi:hypothetical protein